MLLQRLHKNLKSTKKVLSGKKVKSIETIENSVQVTTTSGETFHGDILVGADGIYSTVRQEMHRIAQKESTDYFPEDEWSSKFSRNGQSQPRTMLMQT
jgi:2-polyprenyl-6-methoxyphenol hydroxylase-like FAD-dependent oxidoreductase